MEGIDWHEFLSEDPMREARWGQPLADASPVPQAMVALVDFLRDPAWVGVAQPIESATRAPLTAL